MPLRANFFYHLQNERSIYERRKTMIEIAQRTLGASTVVVPALGVGVMSWGENLLGYGKSHSREDITQAYRACLDAGLIFFDTAEGYGRGESERLLGECRRLDGRPILVASKFGPLPGRSSASDLRKALDGGWDGWGGMISNFIQFPCRPPPPRRSEVRT